MSNVFGFRQPPPGFITEYHGGGGKGGTTTQTVSIPPEVLARYNAVNARAEDTAKQPFQPYGGQFVAGLTPTQQAGQAATSAASQAAQPYFGAATDLTLSGARDVGPLTQGQIGYYQNPAMLATLAPTQAALEQQQGQQLAQQQAEAIRGGAFGGGRDKMQRDILRGQQQLGMGQALAPIYQQAYQTGLSTAQQQQGVVAQDLARRMQAGQQIAGLGTGAQQAALQGAQAQMAAGQVEQQTQQADLTARYQQFLQERGYPFQVAQFLANIAMGTGALSGSTTTTQQPGGFFSDKRLKKDIKEIGETHDGQPIYSYKYSGDDRTQIGLMAQDVEKKHPEAVGLMGGYKTVDYKKATEGAERTHKDMGGGLMPDGFDYNSMGGAVTSGMAGEGFMRGGYVGGGLVGGDDWAQILAANKAALGVYGGAQPMGGPIGAGGIVPQASIPTPKLVTAGAAPQQRHSGMSTAMQTGKDIAGIYKGGKEFLYGSKADESSGLLGSKGVSSNEGWLDKAKDLLKAEGGLIVGRHAYADGGESQGEEAVPYDPSDVMGGKDPMEGVLKAGSQKHEMLKPASAPGGGGGSGLGDVASIMSSAAKIVPFFLKDGGLVPRQGYDEGGPADIPAQATEVPTEDDRLARTLNALKRIESGGKYDIMGPASRTGDRPYGAYQVMGANVPSWTEAALGRRMTPEEFLKNPEAQDATARHRAGLYMQQYNDPRQVASMWLSGKPMEKAGNVADTLGTTVPKYVSMFDRYYGGQDLAPDGKRSTGPVSMGEAASRMSGGEGKKSLGDIVTSEGFVVPALGFLGSMLASNRPNFGQALGEGILGGVGAYQAEQKQSAEMAKGVFDLIKSRFTRGTDEAGNTVFYDTVTGQKVPANAVQAVGAAMLKDRGVDPTAYGFGASTQVAGAPSVETPKAPEAPKAPVVGEKTPSKSDKEWLSKPPDQVNLFDKSESQLIEYAKTPHGSAYFGLDDPNRNPAKLQADINRRRSWAENVIRTGDKEQVAAAQDALKLASDEQKRLHDYLKEAVGLQYAQNQELSKASTQSAAKYEEQISARSEKLPQVRKDLVRLADIFANYEPGRPGEIKAALESWFQGTIGYVPSVLKGQTVNYDEALKTALKEAFASVGENNLSRAPKAALQEAVLTVPNPSSDPGAAYALIGRTLGEMDFLNQRDQDYLASGRGTRPVQFLTQYAKDKGNLIDKFTADVFNGPNAIPVGKGVSQAQRESLGRTYGFTPKPYAETGRSAPEAGPSAPAAPEPIRNLPGLVYSPSRNQYRDAQGNIYDQSGQRVQ